MKIGDKVRFLSEIGGGRISGFKGKNVVLVEDEDGFEIPMATSDVVVIESDDYSMAKIVNAKNNAPADEALAPEGMSIKERMRQGLSDDTLEEETDPSEGEITFRAPVEERKGGNKLSLYLAFVPVTPKEFTTTRFECYLINDSNYYMRYVIMQGENQSYALWHEGEIEPNTKEFICEIGREDLNDLMHLNAQVISYKRDKNFVLKPAVDTQLRLDPVKFYKYHCFEPSDFFEEPTMLITIIENDEQQRPLLIDAKKLAQEMYKKEKDDMKKPLKVTKQKAGDDIIVVDLHATEILETTAGMDNIDILNYQLKVFRDTLEENAKSKGQKIVFIHGKGEGVLRRAIITELNYKYKKYPYQDASFQEYGWGATQVTIK